MTAKDHKRVSRVIDPARVLVDAVSITVIVPDVLGKNESHVAGHEGARHTSTATKRHRESVRLGVVMWRAGDRSDVLVPAGDAGLSHCQAFAGPWRLEVIGVWPRKRDTIAKRPVDFVMPMGDADAAVPQALDALQHAGVLDDDARVVQVSAWNLHRKDQRATIVRLVRVPDLAERDAAIAHLLEHVPAATPEPVKPSTKPRAQKAKALS
jgi:hypothetical protein